MYKYFKEIGNTDHTSSWKSKKLSNQIIKPPSTSKTSLALALSYFGTKTRVKFNGQFFKMKHIYSWNNSKYIHCFELSSILNYHQYAILENCLSGVVKLSKNANISKYKYFRYDIGFDGYGTCLYPSAGFGQNAKIFGVDMSCSVHVDNKKKDFLILVEGPIRLLDDTIITAEKKYSINLG